MADPTIVHSISGTSAVASTAASFGFTAAAGNLLWLTVAADDYKTGDPSGWQLLSPGGSQETFLGHYVWWKKATGSETSVTYVIGSASKSTWHVAEFDNIDAATQLDVGNGTFLQSTGSTMTTPVLTPGVGRRLILATVGGTGGAVTGASGWTNGFTEILDTRTSAPVLELATAWLVMDGTGAATISTTATYDADTPAARTALIASFIVAAPAPDPIPYLARPQPAAIGRDIGETFWAQPVRRLTALVESPAALPGPAAVRTVLVRDPGETFWTQPRRVANPSLLGTALLEGPALGASENGKRLTPATHDDRRLVPQQRTYPAPPDPVELVGTGALGVWWSEDTEPHQIAALRPRVSDPSLLTGTAAPFDPLLAGTTVAGRTPATHSSRRQAGQQHTATAPIDVVDLVGTGALGAWWSDDTTAHYGPAQRARLLDLSLLPSPAGPADPLLAAVVPASTARLVPATHRDRRLVPAQRTAIAAPDDVVIVGTGAMVAWWGEDPTVAYQAAYRPARDPNLLTPGPPLDADPTLLGWLPGWITHGLAASHDDRRLVPQQRPYISDPGTYPAAPPTDPLLLAYGAGGTYWHLYNRAADLVDRREYPAQRAYVSDPLLLTAALLEASLLGGADDIARHRAWFTDRRLVPAQRSGTVPEQLPAGPADPLLVGAGVGGDRWRRTNTPATHAPRWVLRWWRVGYPVLEPGAECHDYSGTSAVRSRFGGSTAVGSPFGGTAGIGTS